MIGLVNHIGLPYPINTTEPELVKELGFWESLGFRITRQALAESADRAGKGGRYWIMAGTKLVFSYAPNVRSEDWIREMHKKGAGLHVALTVTPDDYAMVRSHPRYERETVGWDNGSHSVFLNGPWGLEVEFVFDSATVKQSVEAYQQALGDV